MSDVKKFNSSRRKGDFYESLKLSQTTTNNYRSALQSSFLTSILKADYKSNDVFEITDLETLWNLYSKINLHPKNISSHRAYSAAIMKYIRYLNNGVKYGRRIDYNKKR